MKKLVTIVMAFAFGAFCAAAQYFSTTEGQVMVYKMTDFKAKENNESTMQAKMIKVETAADGVITARQENVQAIEDNPLAELKTYINYSYDPQSDITTVEPMSGDDFKEMILTTIKESARSAGQHLSEMDIADIENVMSVKGSLQFNIDPKAEAGSKLPNATLRLSAGQMSMSMNLWEGKFLGAETVETESGSYDCLKVSFSLRISSPAGNQKRNMTEWYAKGVGMVKSIETDKKGNVLNEEILRVVK